MRAEQTLTSCLHLRGPGPISLALRIRWLYSLRCLMLRSEHAHSKASSPSWRRWCVPFGISNSIDSLHHRAGTLVIALCTSIPLKTRLKCSSSQSVCLFTSPQARNQSTEPTLATRTRRESRWPMKILCTMLPLGPNSWLLQQSVFWSTKANCPGTRSSPMFYPNSRIPMTTFATRPRSATS